MTVITLTWQGTIHVKHIYDQNGHCCGLTAEQILVYSFP